MHAPTRDMPAGSEGTQLAPCWVLVRGPRTVVLAAFGDLGTDDVAAMFAAAVAPRSGPSYAAALIDLAAVGGDGIRFAVGQAALSALGAWRAPSATRAVVVRPDGIAGMLFVGFEALVSTPFPLVLHDARAAAVADLGPDLAAEVAASCAEADRHAAAGAWRVALRRALLADPAAAPSAIAGLLGCSERTLQRRLEAAGASFRGERQRARMEIAIELLAVGHDKVAAIARATGFASESQFCHAFRAYAGCRPSELRARVDSATATARASEPTTSFMVAPRPSTRDRLAS